jgi:hypothetical protein
VTLRIMNFTILTFRTRHPFGAFDQMSEQNRPIRTPCSSQCEGKRSVPAASGQRGEWIAAGVGDD